MLIHHPSNVENYLISHKSETGQPKKTPKNKVFWRTYFTPLCQFMAQNSKYPLLQIFGNKLDIWKISTCQAVTYSKI